MTATVHVLRPQAPAVAGYLRIGHTGHRKLMELEAAGRLPYRRFVFDAAHYDEQVELAKRLKSSGCELVLDPNFAEMATAGRYASSAIQKLSWSNLGRPWEPSDFDRRRNHDLAAAIAEFAVAKGVHAVLAPVHLVDVQNNPWRSTDLRMCEALRYELDRRGGAEIAIDYQLITAMAQLKDQNVRLSFVQDIQNLPIQNVWVRASGFGATATGAGTRHFIEAARDLHGMGRPLVVDMAGGFAALGSAAYGAVGGISHGVGQKESFNAREWKQPPQGGGGASARVYIHELDRYLKEDQLQVIFGVKGGRSRFACADGTCCPHGSEDMLENGHAHFLIQRHRQIDDLSAVPEDRRSGHFLLRHLDPAVRTCRHAGTLKIADENVREVLAKARGRLVRLRDALADLDAQEAAPSRSRSPAFRGGAPAISAIVGR